MTYCPNCFSELEEGATFCGECGTRIDAPTNSPANEAASGFEKENYFGENSGTTPSNGEGYIDGNGNTYYLDGEGYPYYLDGNGSVVPMPTNAANGQARGRAALTGANGTNRPAQRPVNPGGVAARPMNHNTPNRTPSDDDIFSSNFDSSNFKI